MVDPSPGHPENETRKKPESDRLKPENSLNVDLIKWCSGRFVKLKCPTTAAQVCMKFLIFSMPGSRSCTD